jgi:uncharacterized membrane protein
MATRTVNTSTKVLLASAVAGLLALNALGGTAWAADKTEDGKIKCYGANACKGQGACGGAGHDCAGKNACKGKGWVEMSADDCKAKGGTAKQ